MIFDYFLRVGFLTFGNNVDWCFIVQYLHVNMYVLRWNYWECPWMILWPQIWQHSSSSRVVLNFSPSTKAGPLLSCSLLIWTVALAWTTSHLVTCPCCQSNDEAMFGLSALHVSRVQRSCRSRWTRTSNRLLVLSKYTHYLHFCSFLRWCMLCFWLTRCTACSWVSCTVPDQGLLSVSEFLRQFDMIRVSCWDNPTLYTDFGRQTETECSDRKEAEMPRPHRAQQIPADQGLLCNHWQKDRLGLLFILQPWVWKS